MSKKILVLSHDNKVGDAIVATGLFQPLKKLWPTCQIGVLCGPNNAPIYLCHPDVTWTHISKSRNVFYRAAACLQARMKHYDLLVHFGLDLKNTSTQIIFNLIQAKQRFLFADPANKAKVNDVILSGPWYGPESTEHFSARHLAFLRSLGVAPSNYAYDLRLPADHATSIGQQRSFPKLVINSQGSTSNRSVSVHWLNELMDQLALHHSTLEITLLSANADHERQQIDSFSNRGAKVKIAPWQPSIMSTLSEIKNADIVLTPDTYAVHAASAWNIPVVALYESNGATTHLWSPLSQKKCCLLAPKDQPVEKIKPAEVAAGIAGLLPA